MNFEAMTNHSEIGGRYNVLLVPKLLYKKKVENLRSK